MGENKILNKSELARSIGLSPTLFNLKLNKVNYNRFSQCELRGLKIVIDSEVEKFFELATTSN